MSRPFETNVSSKYGAPMGRKSDQIEGEVTVERVALYDGAYDKGGAYWGDGAPLWCAFNSEGAAYVRADSYRVAVECFQADYDCTVIKGHDMNIEAMVDGYLTAALWTSNDESNTDGSGGDPLDDNYSLDDISPELYKRATADCEAFCKANREILESYSDDPANVGHDFWLTRIGSGCGFRDGDYETIAGDGAKLTEAAHKFGSFNLWVADGKVYGE